jgi:uncharacterized MAPEG superfamily protein
VIVAHMVEGPSVTVDVLAIVYVLTRVGRLAAYLADRPPLRSAAFTIAQLGAAAIFIRPLSR